MSIPKVCACVCVCVCVCVCNKKSKESRVYQVYRILKIHMVSEWLPSSPGSAGLRENLAAPPLAVVTHFMEAALKMSGFLRFFFFSRAVISVYSRLIAARYSMLEAGI